MVLFTVAVVYLLYEGAGTGDYLLIGLVLTAYVFVRMLESSLSSRSRPAKRTISRDELVDERPQYPISELGLRWRIDLTRPHCLHL